MIYLINYADEKYVRAQRFNTMMGKRHGVDQVIEYGPADVDDEYKRKNASIWNAKRGAGYWIWKPYIIAKTLQEIDEGDYLLYMDVGGFLEADVYLLIDAMEEQGTDIMVFALPYPERCFAKRDAFILMGCDTPEYVETKHRLASFVLLKKTDRAQRFVEEWLQYCEDERIVTDNPNVMGKENYEGFRDNRHDQTVLSLLSKKWGIAAFRDPSELGDEKRDEFDRDVLNRSPYKRVICLHRNKKMPKSYVVYKLCPIIWKEHWIRLTYQKLCRIMYQKYCSVRNITHKGE